MRVILQRVKNASVEVNGKIVGKINKGILILLGICNIDNEDDISWLVKKITGLRIFGDTDNKMNLSNEDTNGQYMVISQFTLYASTKKGNRPSYINAARPEVAIPLYEAFIEKLNKHTGKTIERGIFGADMKVQLLNDGPVTIFIDSKDRQ